MNDDKYDYETAVEADVLEWLEENAGGEPVDPEKALFDIENSDLVTGNASGSYYCSTWKAESALCHNKDLVDEAIEELGSFDRSNPETTDVCVRFMLVGRVAPRIIEEWNKNHGA